MGKSKKVPGEKKLPSGAMLFNGRVKLWGSDDPKTYENLTTYQCNKCGATKELREEVPNLAKRAAFRAEAKAHNCEVTMRSKQFANEANELEKRRRDIHG